MVAINIKATGMFIWTSWYWHWVSSLVKVGKNLTFYFYNRIWPVRILWLIEFSDHACNIFTKKFNCDSHMLDVSLVPFSVPSFNKFKLLAISFENDPSPISQFTIRFTRTSILIVKAALGKASITMRRTVFNQSHPSPLI